MEDPTVSVIILNWNGKDYLQDCLKSIEKNTKYPNFDLIVVDNNSEDGSKKLVEENFSQVELIENPKNLGFSIANNIAIHRCETDYYLLLNNDTEVEDAWLSELVQTSEERDAGIVGPKLLYPKGKIQSAGIRLPELDNYREGMDSGTIDEITQEKGVLGAAFLIDSEVVNDIGFLDEVFSPADHEESDYCSRARAAGHDVVLNPNVNVVHKNAKSKEKQESRFKYFYMHKNRIKYEVMNAPSSVLYQSLQREFKTLIAAIIGYSYNPLGALLKSYKEVLVDFPQLLRKRRHREKFIPSYYCENIKDYSERYS